MSVHRSMKPAKTSLEDILHKDNNCFHLIRIIAALAVIFGHSYALFPIDIGARYFTLAGRFAVCVFFLISGILISASFNNSVSKIRFILMRVCRIWPGLIVCIFMTTFVLGPIVSTISARSYFFDPSTMQYFTSSIKLSSSGFLPGDVFTNNHLPGINGSLWTLLPEVSCYFFIFIVGITGILSSRIAVNTLCIGWFLLALFIPESRQILPNEHWVRVTSWFMLGMFAYANRDWILLDWKIELGLFLLWLMLWNWEYHTLITSLFVSYTVLFLSGNNRLRAIKLSGDYSYGVYLYGFLVQQTIYFYLPFMKSTSSLFFTLPISLALGVLSWNSVEKPSLKIAKLLSDLWQNGKIRRQIHSGIARFNPRTLF